MGDSLGKPQGYRNQILSALPAEFLEQLDPQLRRVSLVSGQVLHERGQPIDDVYFVETGIASLTANTFDGADVEVGITGSEGIVGVPALLTARPVAVQRAFIQVPGEALKLTALALTEALAASPPLRDGCLSYVNALMNQSAQTAACNARHDVTERLARWLLMSLDRVDSNYLPFTQEFLAVMLGVRRTGIAVCAGALQADELIQYSRGRITVIDRVGLEAASCGCYALVRQQRPKP